MSRFLECTVKAKSLEEAMALRDAVTLLAGSCKGNHELLATEAKKLAAEQTALAVKCRQEAHEATSLRAKASGERDAAKWALEGVERETKLLKERLVAATKRKEALLKKVQLAEMGLPKE